MSLNNFEQALTTTADTPNRKRVYDAENIDLSTPTKRAKSNLSKDEERRDIYLWMLIKLRCEDPSTPDRGELIETFERSINELTNKIRLSKNQ